MRTALSRARESVPAQAQRAAARRGASAVGGRASAQGQRASALNDSARVRRQEARADAAQIRRRPDASGGVIQRDRLDWASASGGAAALGTAGFFLGGLPGAFVGGVLGAIGGYVGNRLAVPRPLWSEANQPKGSYKTWNSPATLADQLKAASPEFKKLRGQADEVSGKRYQRPLEYGALSAEAAREHSAGYAHGRVSVDPTNHPSMVLQDLIFETANATQDEFFANVRTDHEEGRTGERSIEYYAKRLGRSPEELDTFREEYASADPIARRTLIQEWAEYHSLEKARPALEALGEQLESRAALQYWDKGFGHKLEAQSFREYYDAFGWRHRRDVEERLRKPRK